MSDEVARTGLHRECKAMWSRIINHENHTASPEETLVAIRAEDAHRASEAKKKRKGIGKIDPPPGGVPVLGRDFTVGGEPYYQRDESMCECGHGLRIAHHGMEKTRGDCVSGGAL